MVYVWHCLAPNFSNPITSTFSGRRGRSCVIFHVNVGRVGTLAYNIFRWRSIRLFNSLPIHLRSISSCSVLRFKTQLDIFLGSVEDLPCLPGSNNSLDGGEIVDGGHLVMAWQQFDVAEQTHKHKQHSTVTELHTLNNTVVMGYNQMAPPARTITVALYMSNALDTINIHTLIRKLQQTNIPGTIMKFITNYTKGRKA